MPKVFLIDDQIARHSAMMQNMQIYANIHIMYAYMVQHNQLTHI